MGYMAGLLPLSLLLPLPLPLPLLRLGILGLQQSSKAHDVLLCHLCYSHRRETGQEEPLQTTGQGGLQGTYTERKSTLSLVQDFLESSNNVSEWVILVK